MRRRRHGRALGAPRGWGDDLLDGLAAILALALAGCALLGAVAHGLGGIP